MSQAPFEHHTYVPGSYEELIATSQDYASTAPFDTPLTTMDHSLVFPLGAFSETPRNNSLFHIASSGASGLDSHIAYSPAHSPGVHLAQPPRLSASSESGTSVQSTSSSSMGSPHLNAQYSNEWHPVFNNNLDTLQDASYFQTTADQSAGKMTSFVDPTVVSHPFTFSPVYPDLPAPTSPGIFEQPSSSGTAVSRTGKVKKSPAHSPFSHFSSTNYPYHSQRRQSTSSSMSRNSSQRSGSLDVDEVEGGRGVCPIAECGKTFKDLKAHMLTHQNERPEKCPIPSCEYHVKGFARKYDKNRHTLTHYKGTMVCGFCPGSGSSAEKSFNRADVFKRHLTSVHGVEQVPPNARRKSPSSRKSNNSTQGSGTCSTCSVTFTSAQDFYEHLDDCVLRVVQQIDPAEAINEKHLTTISEDKEVQDMLEKHNLTGNEYANVPYEDDEDEEDDDDSAETRAQRSGKGAIKLKKGDSAGAGTSWHTSSRVNKRRTGLTLSKGGVRLAGPAGAARKKRKNYPASWGCSADKMRMKKRVLCAYDGQRRLWKDDLMLDAEFEVRVPLPSVDGRAYVTDLDIQTLRRAEAIFGATEEERGPWVPDNVVDVDFAQLLV